MVERYKNTKLCYIYLVFSNETIHIVAAKKNLIRFFFRIFFIYFLLFFYHQMICLNYIASELRNQHIFFRKGCTLKQYTVVIHNKDNWTLNYSIDNTTHQQLTIYVCLHYYPSLTAVISSFMKHTTIMS